MNPSSPPELPDQPSFLRRHGCLTVVVVLVVLVIVAGAVLRHVIVATTVPYRVFASMIQKSNPNVKITGITGSIQTGLGVESITWGDDPANRAEIRDLRIQYSGSRAAGGKYNFVIHDAGVGKAHFDLADLGGGASSTTTTTTVVTTNGSTTTTTTATPFSALTTGPQGGLAELRVDRLSIADVLVTNRATNFRLSIPKVEWTGFKATPTSLEAGVLTVESDRLVIHTSPGRTLPYGGGNVAFQKLLTGTALAALHPALKKDIPFTADLSFTPQGDMRPAHVVAAEDKFEVDANADGSDSVQVRNLDVASYLEAKELFGASAADLPSDLVLHVVAAKGWNDATGKVSITGSFRLGVSTFQIEPLEFVRSAQAGAILQAVLKTDDGNIVWALPLANGGQDFHPHFISPGVAPEEVLARVFYGHSYTELSADEKKAVDARRPVYFQTADK